MLSADLGSLSIEGTHQQIEKFSTDAREEPGFINWLLTVPKPREKKKHEITNLANVLNSGKPLKKVHDLH